MSHRTLDTLHNAVSEPEREDTRKGEQTLRAVAFHLPQFHPIAENDEWWGKGFTEWTNVVRARPRFPGHFQPHLPADLGFYDLRLPEARRAQAELAGSYGIYGFCYYHYWFNGRRLLERPVNEIWKMGEPDFPFCLCWANENWTRRWDALESEILMKQEYGLDDDLDHIRGLIPLFADHRYIHVQGKPLFLVYRASRLPQPQRTTELWRREAEKAGFKGLFLVRVEGYDEPGDPFSLGFDASVGFPPRWPRVSRIYRQKWWHIRRLGTAEPGIRENHVHDYAELVRNALADPIPPYPRIPCVCTGWDNSPRRSRDACIFINSTPEKYEFWLTEIANRLKERMLSDGTSGISPSSLVFINAWNEWAEGNHLEPCQKWGRKYLDATRRALQGQVSRSLASAND